MSEAQKVNEYMERLNRIRENNKAVIQPDPQIAFLLEHIDDLEQADKDYAMAEKLMKHEFEREISWFKAENEALKQKLLTAGFHKVDKDTHINESAQFVKEATEKIEAQAEEIRTLKNIQAESECIVKGRQERLKEAEGVIEFYANMTPREATADLSEYCSYQAGVVSSIVGGRAHCYLLSKTPKKDNT